MYKFNVDLEIKSQIDVSNFVKQCLNIHWRSLAYGLTVPVKLSTKLFLEEKNTGCADGHVTERAVKFCKKHLQCRSIMYDSVGLLCMTVWVDYV